VGRSTSITTPFLRPSPSDPKPGGAGPVPAGCGLRAAGCGLDPVPELRGVDNLSHDVSFCRWDAVAWIKGPEARGVL
jgi:hypothetical protein